MTFTDPDAPQRTLLFLVFQQLQVFGDQLASLFYAVRGSVRILRCVEQIVLEFVDCGGCYMHSCIAGCIVVDQIINNWLHFTKRLLVKFHRAYKSNDRLLDLHLLHQNIYKFCLQVPALY